MSTASFDTHAYYKRLTDSGVTPGAAEAQLSVMTDWIASQDLRTATKSDIDSVRNDVGLVRKDVEVVRAGIEVVRAEMLRSIAELKAHLVWYMLAFSLAQVGLVVGLVRALH